MSDISLTEVIGKLRDELDSSAQVAKEKGARFSLKEAEIELSFTVTKDVSGSGGIKFQVLSVGAKVDGGVSASSGATHSMRLTLTPIGSTEVSGQKTYDPTRS